jgi:DNA polymerase-3 subunit epsilon
MSRDKFLQSVTVLDTETTSMYPEQAEIVEIAAARWHNSNWTVNSSLFGSVTKIPPEASAKNHISWRMIDGLPIFAASQSTVDSIFQPGATASAYYVAHNCPYDQTVLAVNWADCSRDDMVALAQDSDRWICTHRLAKRLLDDNFTDIEYNLSYLRYKLDLPVDDNLTAHRAAADTLVCAELFEFLVDYALDTGAVQDGDDLGQQMHDLCWRAIPYKTWPFGKYKGKAFTEIPTDYYLWALENLDALNSEKADYNQDLCESVRVELESRI